MKNISHYIIAFTIVCLSACSTSSSSDADLDNWWYLTQIDNLSTGQTTADYRQARVFWSFQGSLMQFEKKDIDTYYVCHFQKIGSTIYQNQLYCYDRMNGDIPMTQDSIVQRNLGAYGISQPVDTFSIELLNSDNLILRNKKLRLHYDRY